MYKILLHVGLHKTATTSLQQNVLSKLHQSKKINYIATRHRYLSTKEENTRSDLLVFLKKSTGQTDAQKKQAFEKLLSKDMLNVISDEMLTALTFFSPSSLEKLHGVKDVDITLIWDLIAPYESEVLISLRNPLDYFYSFYVTIHSHLHAYGKKELPLKEYVQYFSKNPLEDRWSSYYSYKTVSLISSLSNKKVKILLYEDLKHDKNTYFEHLAHLLGEDKQLIESMFMTKMQNVTKKSSSGYHSESIRLSTKINAIGQKILNSRCAFLLHTLAPILRYPWKMISGIIILKSIEYPHLTDEEKEQLKPILLKDNEKLHTEFGVELEKLKKYGYLLEKQ